MKDALILAVVLFLGIYLPFYYYGGFGAMFHAIDAASPASSPSRPRGRA